MNQTINQSEGKIQVGVVYGGRSVEHEVSIISALQAIHALDKDKYRPLPLYISKAGQWYSGDALLQIEAYRDLPRLLQEAIPVTLSPNYGERRISGPARGPFKKPWSERLDVVLPVIHGSHGEDGCLQGLLELSGIPYAGPGVLGAAAAMDKIIMKAVLKEAGLPVVPYLWFTSQAWQSEPTAQIERIECELNYPLVIKPADLGSSIGVSHAANRAELTEALDLAASFSSRLLVEQAVRPLRELNCAVLGSAEAQQFSAIEEPLIGAELLSFQDKYLQQGGAKGMQAAKRRIPADISSELADAVRDLSRRAFLALDGFGVCRIDFLLQSDTNTLYVNELNTIPGSLSFYLFEPQGKSFADLLDDLLQLALQRYRIKEQTVYTYDSNILAQAGFKGKK